MKNLSKSLDCEPCDNSDESALDLRAFEEIENRAGGCYFDKKGASDDIAAFGFPAYFLNHKTASFANALWPGTHPNQDIPFLFGLYVLREDRSLEHHVFLDHSGNDPSQAFADELATYCGTEGPIYVYGAVAVRKSLSQLVERFPVFTHYFESIERRLVDLRVIARKRYWHPDLHARWSLSSLTQVLFPDVAYQTQAEDIALDLWVELNDPQTPEWRKQEIVNFVYALCKTETFWLVMIRDAFFEGKKIY